MHGVPVPGRATGMVQLVVSELLTNACEHAPGPCPLDPELAGGLTGITVRDSVPALPVAGPADPRRVGRHGLEIAP
ncbi:hypothetical protein GCM10010129_05500 [Streptomyces fumigatiscleroticus]|nr:hypothetical protein GCM10010129_05500 [Streptomyces fumigatiscleroticus]